MAPTWPIVLFLAIRCNGVNGSGAAPPEERGNDGYKLYLSALHLFQDGKYDASANAWGQLSSAAPFLPEVRLNWAVALEAAGRFQEAADVLKHAARQFPKSEKIQLRLAALDGGAKQVRLPSPNCGELWRMGQSHTMAALNGRTLK